VTTNVTVASLYQLASQNPMLLVIMAVQFIMGLIAGYLTAKIAKYVIALIGTFLVGALLGIWGTASSVNEAVKRIEALAQLKDVAYKLAQVFGFMALGPTTIGFIIGLIIGVVRK
jgi:uncharacterized membrane protein (Fun14 family)